jgi:hypothetical protein
MSSSSRRHPESLFFHVFAALAEFERLNSIAVFSSSGNLIRERDYSWTKSRALSRAQMG